MLYKFLSFFNKNPLTIIYNSFSEKESLKIRKVTWNTEILYNSSNKVKIICITEWIWQIK